ncbi:hypothetical protein ASG11_05760 [Sphingomonas sp. Leaf357]|uniref:hypothetical protein n=1 Tax=Sphingomonas sp. Leaf357 TaxID=1736350 RepID=UPI0006F33A98|nr:hypothetical protein [Sphingomonas sp. Leaf357]KQS03809.1 hypothetical protein ASG11_05760 [Sphingomonas sp. Leaf357]
MIARHVFRLIVALMLACVALPAQAADLTVDKSSTPVADQVNTLTPARNLPGATIDYSLNVTNPALNLVVIRRVVIVDVIPASVKFRVLPYGSGSGPVEFTNGNLLTIPLGSSGLTYAGVEYYDGVSWNYVPQDDGTGYDGNVRSIRVTMSTGAMTAGGSFRLRYRVMLK